MSGDPKECRKHAARCAELATLAKGEQLKAMLLELSTSWQMLALGLESVLGTLDEAQTVSPRVARTSSRLDGRYDRRAGRSK
jgi:hypothetical protein